MYVKNRMTVNPFTVGPEQTISEVLDLMKDHEFHRVPVVDKGRLVGLITNTTIQANTPSHLTTLSIHEMNYLLSKTKVSDIMIKHVVTVSPNTTVEEAADTMEKKDIGCLPVVGDDNLLLGIITTGDILKAFVELMGYNSKDSTRLTVTFPEDKPGVFAEFAKVFADNNISLTHASLLSSLFHVRCNSTDKEFLKKLLEEKGYTIVDIS